MSRARRSLDWGFPRWRGYGGAREAQQLRLCDRHGCGQPGTCPAPKAPHSAERWYFCQAHAAEYNAQWDYFAGLGRDEAEQRARDERRAHGGYAAAAHYGWASPGDGSRSADEIRALEVLGLPPDAGFEAIRKAWRDKAKQVHPDIRPGDEEAARAFQTYSLAYEVLRMAEERRAWKG